MKLIQINRIDRATGKVLETKMMSEDLWNRLVAKIKEGAK